MIALCKSTSIVIGNGHLHNDESVGEITFYSKNGSSVVDYFLLQKQDFSYVIDFRILNQNEFSDHSGLSFSFEKSTLRSLTKDSENVNTQQPFIKFDETKVDQFKRLLSAKETEISSLTAKLDNSADLNGITSEFINILHKSSLEIFGQKKTNGTNPTKQTAWFNQECKIARKQFNKAKNDFNRNKANAQLRSDYITSKLNYNKIKKVNKYKFLQKEKENLSRLSKTNPKLFWQRIKQQYSKEESRSDNVNISEMYDHFTNLFSTENTTNDDTTFNNTVLHDEELEKDIAMTELREAIFSQKNNKSIGPDEISAEIYKCAFEDIAPFILKLFNRLLSNGEYPICFGEGIIHPIHKGGDKNNPKNYRGITLINILSKIYSQLILNRLTRWSKKHSKISQNQFGFQKKKSTIDCIFVLHSIIAKTLADGKKNCIALF